MNIEDTGLYKLVQHWPNAKRVVRMITKEIPFFIYWDGAVIDKLYYPLFARVYQVAVGQNPGIDIEPFEFLVGGRAPEENLLFLAGYYPGAEEDFLEELYREHPEFSLLSNEDIVLRYDEIKKVINKTR